MYKVLWLLYATVFMSIGLIAQNSQPMTSIKDLKNNWLTVSADGKNYVPYITGSALSYPVIGIILDGRTSSGLVLNTCISEGTSIFVNNKIVDRVKSDGCRFYDIDSLLSSQNQQTLFISFFKDNLNPDLITTTLMTVQPSAKLQAQTYPTAQIVKRSTDDFMDFFVIAILLVAAFYAFLINRYPKGYKDFFNFSKAFSLTLKEEKVLTQRNMSTANAIFLWMYSMVISLVIILFWRVFGGIPELLDFIKLDTFQRCFLGWFSLSLLAYAVIGLKYLLIKVLCSLLNLDKIAQIHFFDFIRISLIFISAILVVLSVLFLSFLNQIVPFTIVLYLFLLLLGVRIVILLFKLIADTSYRKIHLISYLCTTEILPLLIGIRIFF